MNGKVNKKPIMSQENHVNAVALRPFYQEPRHLLFHNILIANQLHLINSQTLTGNTLALGGLFLFSTQFEGGLNLMTGLQVGGWLLWYFGGTQMKNLLTSSDLLGVVTRVI